ncbi:MAG TPA: heavy metal translocating P-type ATPase [Abditibacterium sp.]|jgi:Cd2+/Zn2+-exporting ATPase
MKQSHFFLAGMCCPTEQQLVRKALKPVQGIESLDFNTMQRELTVSHSLDDDQNILMALESLGLGAQRKQDAANHTGHASHSAEQSHEHHHHEDQNAGIAAKVGMGVAGIAAFASEAVAYSTGNEQSLPVIALALFSIAVGGRETLYKGFLALKNRTLNINFLMSLAVLGAIFIGHWPEAAMVTWLFGIAEMIEAYSLDRARNAISGLMAMTPETATVQLDGGQWSEIAASEVQIGQIVHVKPGERIPLDGVLVAGQSSVNQAPITGESLPVEKKIGDSVFAGAINERGAFQFRVSALSSDTTLARIIRSVQEAQASRAPTQRFIDNFARFYTPVIVALAVLVAIVPPLLLAQPFQLWLYKSLVLLVIACPCALVISTPVSVVSGLAAAAKLGILIKGGVHLEAGRNLKIIALDKTGTLTQGQPVVTDIIPLQNDSSDELLQLAASLDAASEHPIAAAIVTAWTGELLPVDDFESLTGRGVRGRVGNSLYFIGNHGLVEENGVCGPHVEAILNRLESEGKTAVVLMTERESLAVFGVADTLRETSAEAVRELHALGVQTVMLTGDNSVTARFIAQQVGIRDARGDLLPDDKLRAMKELLEKHGAVGMVGDGINDAPTLAQATVGFAMGAAGTDTAIETADVALMRDDLRLLPQFIRLSRQTGRILKQNIAFSIGIKALFFALAFAGHATLWMAVFADMGASLLVVFNGLRLLRFGTSHSKTSF